MTDFTYRVEYLTPGSFMPEESFATLTSEDPELLVQEAVIRAPLSAYCFTIYKVPVIDFDYDPELFVISGKRVDETERYYIGGTTHTEEQLRNKARAEGDPQKYDILISNVTQSAFEGIAIHCTQGNWQPFQPSKGEVLLKEPQWRVDLRAELAAHYEAARERGDYSPTDEEGKVFGDKYRETVAAELAKLGIEDPVETT